MSAIARGDQQPEGKVLLVDQSSSEGEPGYRPGVEGDCRRRASLGRRSSQPPRLSSPLHAFQAVIDLAADIIEFDVRLIRDGAVVIHDV